MLHRTIVIYTLALTGWFAARLLWFDTFWWLAMLNTAALGLFLPLPVLAALALWHRANTGLLLLIPALLLGWLYAPLADRTPQTAPAGTPVRVMTLNLLYRNRNMAAVGDAARAYDIDMLGVQELARNRQRALEQALSFSHPYRAMHHSLTEAGVGLFSRYPIVSAQTFALPPRNLALHAVVDVHGQQVDVLVVHLSPNRAAKTLPWRLPTVMSAHYATQASEVSAIVQELQQVRGPVLLLCDCNLTDTSQAYDRLASVLQDSFWQAGQGFGHTFPAWLPFQRYDYIWHSAAFTATASVPGPAAGSDHRSVISTLVLQSP